ncbi:MAG TPA: GGDEF domain-containing protein [Arenimonas sp.]|uniref:GGDEF domain-containing protein n=1 Tax=Arenimonas sp. TaxID=1872635 RepID=UPI002D7FF626|nr:GGDEF domain-containing protein [Arenimonas sp.]HEU0152428.1 GGDEF domain-containing protein [Arenimonas sp.]
MPHLRRDSFTLLRELMRWRVAMVLSVLIFVLMIVLGTINTRLGLADTAQLAWITLATAGACIAALLVLPRHLGGTVFFVSIGLLLVGVMAFGLYHGRPMQHWAYIFPPVLVFLVSSRRALAGMVAYGIYASAMLAPLVPAIDVVRFSSGYGLLVCFMFTYALLQERAAVMLRYHSDHDALSNCLNRRTFNEAVEQLASDRSDVGGAIFLLIDIDGFKAINDRHGHLAGDRIITLVAAELGRTLAPDTPLFRYGGEEFSVLLAERTLEHGRDVAERLRAAVAATDFQGVAVTISIGVAGWRRGEGSITAALDRADRALYQAKRDGRNRVVADTP